MEATTMSQSHHPSPPLPTSGNGDAATVPAPDASGADQSAVTAAEPWRIIGHSALGASHARKGLVNQDAIKWIPPDGSDARVALSVADGHGSARSFRSATGSRFAVEVALALAAPIIEQSDLGLPLVKNRLEEAAPQQLVRDWRVKVEADLEQNPFSEEELLRVQDREGRPALESVEKNPLLAYGSTLLTVIVTQSFAVFWQIGDGDMVTVSATGDVSRPLRGDDRLVADETMSLCSPDAWRYFRVGVLGTPAPMVMLSTDGLSNSFQDDEGFFKFGSDVRGIIAAEGVDAVADKLPSWLDEITKQGSGDDISLGIVCRPCALSGQPWVPPAKEKESPERESDTEDITLILRERSTVILAFFRAGRWCYFILTWLPLRVFRRTGKKRGDISADEPDLQGSE